MYNCYQKPYLPVTAVDYAAIKQPELFYIPHNRIKGNLPLYHKAGSKNVWMHPDSTVRLNPDMRIIEYQVDGKLYKMFKLETFEYFKKHER